MLITYIVLKKLAIYLKNSSSLPFFKLHLHNRTQCVLLHGSYSSKKSVKYGVPQGSVWGPILFSLFINDLPLHLKNISVGCDMLPDDTTLHTSGKDILQIRSNMQDNLDQVSSWCDNNHMVINPIKTKSITIATRQKHQLSPLPLDLVLNGEKIDRVSEHRLLGITIIIIIIIMYIYHALINALSVHMIHINLNMIFYTHVEHSPTKRFT